MRGPGSSVGIATGYGLDVPGIESRWGEIFLTCPDRPWSPPSLLYNGYRVFPGVKNGRSVTLTPHLLLVPWSRKSRAIPLLPLWAVRPVQSLSVCTRVHFTFTFTILMQDNPFSSPPVINTSTVLVRNYWFEMNSNAFRRFIIIIIFIVYCNWVVTRWQ